MTDYSELKRLAEAATQGDWRTGEWMPKETVGRHQVVVDSEIGPYVILGGNQNFIEDAKNNAAFVASANPAAVLALIAENERLAEDLGKTLRALKFIHQCSAHADLYRELLAERDQLKAENELAGMRIKELDLLFGRYILAMRSAVIEEEHGKGPAAAMEWIYNSLAGPGELPPEGETDSQGYFDREIVAVDRGMSEIMAFHRARRAAMSQGEQA